ncbi:hypothetical protein [Mesorhizobium sp. M1396]|uniref:hypothetical protein n=1 Tax=Mesorhizobium sp. M1396 TaxID=2957095 RepID=UPI003336A38E
MILGIELKGWYALAKEEEPSFRFQVTPAVCASADLLVVVPWTLSKVISGSPQVFTPFVIGARHAAEFRNWHWEHAKGGTNDNSLILSTVSTNYPMKSDAIADRAVSDGGGNFGRLARSGVMKEYIENLFDDRLSGIPLWAWQKFLGLFKESKSDEFIERGLKKLAANLASGGKSEKSVERQAKVQALFHEISDLLIAEEQATPTKRSPEVEPYPPNSSQTGGKP